MRFLLIPGAGGVATYWHRVVPLLAERGHEAVPVDLPADDASAGLNEYAQVAVETAAEFETDGPLVVVGQSLGGFTAPVAADELGAVLMVFLNAMIPEPGETPGDWAANTGQRQAMADNDRREGRAPGEFDEQVYFLHDVPADERELLAAERRVQAEAVFATPFPSRWPNVPAAAIGSQDDRLFPIDFQRELARRRLGKQLDVVPGGHLTAVSRPVEVVQRLLAQAARHA